MTSGDLVKLLSEERGDLFGLAGKDLGGLTGPDEAAGLVVLLDGNLDPVGDDWSWKSRRWLVLNHFLVGEPAFLFFVSFFRRLTQQQQKKHSPKMSAAIAIEATDIPTVSPVVKGLGDWVGAVEGLVGDAEDGLDTLSVGPTVMVLGADVMSTVELVGTDVGWMVCEDGVDVDVWNDVVIVNTGCVPTTAFEYEEHKW
jgi:hypothetical protein